MAKKDNSEKCHIAKGHDDKNSVFKQNKGKSKSKSKNKQKRKKSTVQLDKSKGSTTIILPIQKPDKVIKKKQSSSALMNNSYK